MKCLVTGANGFVGAHLVRHLLNTGHEVRAVVSTEQTGTANANGVEYARVARSEVDATAWQAACRDVDVIFHLAGRAHHGDAFSPAARAVYFRDNWEMTRALTQAAITEQVRRFVFSSSVTVYGVASVAAQPLREDTSAQPHPDDVFAQSKLAAEKFLLSNEIRAALEPVIVRLPLVYGAGVKGNMAMLIKLTQSGLPLPLAGIDNRRSFVNIPNCVDFLLTAATYPDATGKILLTSDGEDVSTPDLLRAIAHASGKSVRLFSVPLGLLKAACILLGKKAYYEKLAGNFQIDSSASCKLLGWSPKVSFTDGIAQMCAEDKSA
ncbi:MAG: NAD-dependent epimerase/dehydratase family protein [Methylobacillus sp.]|jgi:nucleoside-diphosphate-sugar epimerase|nr:NAD-dependent epimerase/dehydratase family protein [Methylobacillus sp.]